MQRNNQPKVRIQLNSLAHTACIRSPLYVLKLITANRHAAKQHVPGMADKVLEMEHVSLPCRWPGRRGGGRWSACPRRGPAPAAPAAAGATPAPPPRSCATAPEPLHAFDMSSEAVPCAFQCIGGPSSARLQLIRGAAVLAHTTALQQRALLPSSGIKQYSSCEDVLLGYSLTCQLTQPGRTFP